MAKQDFLPPEAIPGLIDLMSTFKKALRGQTRSFKKTGDATELQRTIGKLRSDLIHFNETFDHWYQNADTYLEYQLLEEFAKELGEAQELLCEAKETLKDKL